MQAHAPMATTCWGSPLSPSPLRPAAVEQIAPSLKATSSHSIEFFVLSAFMCSIDYLHPFLEVVVK